METSIVKQENVEIIISTAPKAYSENSLSHTRAIAAGKELYNTALAGMTDEIDKQISEYLDKVRRTVVKMNELRSPTTKLFDEIRSAFTALESELDVKKSGTITYQLQELRNQYARRKHEEAERIRLQEQMRLQKEQTKQDYYRKLYNNYYELLLDKLEKHKQYLLTQFCSLTLSNYDETYNNISQWSTEVPDKAYLLPNNIVKPTLVTQEEATAINTQVIEAIKKEYSVEYRDVITLLQENLLRALPDKLDELRAISSCSAEEAENMKRELEKREEETQRALKIQMEGVQQASEVQQQAQQQVSEIEGLFNSAATATIGQSYTPKTICKKKITLLHPEGILPIISMWFTAEGKNLTIEELAKIFKKQITYAEKQANATNSTLIENKYIRYDDDIRAK